MRGNVQFQIVQGLETLCNPHARLWSEVRTVSREVQGRVKKQRGASLGQPDYSPIHIRLFQLTISICNLFFLGKQTPSNFPHQPWMYIHLRELLISFKSSKMKTSLYIPRITPQAYLSFNILKLSQGPISYSLVGIKLAKLRHILLTGNKKVVSS